jgi:hypothetical protein
MIDVLIPLVVGIVILVFPQRFVKPSSDPGLQAKYEKRLRWAGWALLGAAAIYFVLMLLKPA